jgi:hypothetical protein
MTLKPPRHLIERRERQCPEVRTYIPNWPQRDCGQHLPTLRTLHWPCWMLGLAAILLDVQAKPFKLIWAQWPAAEGFYGHPWSLPHPRLKIESHQRAARVANRHGGEARAESGRVRMKKPTSDKPEIGAPRGIQFVAAPKSDASCNTEKCGRRRREQRGGSGQCEYTKRRRRRGRCCPS